MGSPLIYCPLSPPLLPPGAWFLFASIALCILFDLMLLSFVWRAMVVDFHHLIANLPAQHIQLSSSLEWPDRALAPNPPYLFIFKPSFGQQHHQRHQRLITKHHEKAQIKTSNNLPIKYQQWPAEKENREGNPREERSASMATRSSRVTRARLVFRLVLRMSAESPFRVCGYGKGEGGALDDFWSYAADPAKYASIVQQNTNITIQGSQYHFWETRRVWESAKAECARIKDGSECDAPRISTNPRSLATEIFTHLQTLENDRQRMRVFEKMES